MDRLPALLMVAPLLGLAACATLTSAQQERNEALWRAARSCENGSLSVVRMSNEGVPYTQTINSSGFEFEPFKQCYTLKARPIWQEYCRAEPSSPQCRPAR